MFKPKLASLSSQTTEAESHLSEHQAAKEELFEEIEIKEDEIEVISNQVAERENQLQEARRKKNQV